MISLLPRSGIVRPVYASEATAGATQRPTIQPGPIRNLLARTRRVKRTTGQRKAAGEPEAAGEPVICPLGLRANHRTTAWTKLSTRSATPSAGGSPRIRHPNPPGMAARIGEAMRPPACGLPARRISLANFPALSIMLLVLLLCMRIEPARARPPDALRVRLEAGPGPYYEGQGIEMAALVLGRDQRPRIELPRLSHAEIWTAGTSFKPVSATGIGSVESGDNLYITRLRIVPRRSGPLEIPPILARIDGRSGRSGPLRLTVEPVPFEGRPAEFLGGVGEFSVQASVMPTTIRVGQEFIYRIGLTGPAAWGTTSRPDLSRFDRIPLALRVEPLPDERTSEPPSVTFVYRIRPTRAGSGVVPPVAIAAFDPRSMRYITKVTQGVPIKAAAVPAFDPRTINYTAPDGDRNRRIAWASTALVLILCAFLGLAVVIRRRRRLARQTSLRQAQRIARRMVRELNNTTGEAGASERCEGEVARRIIDGLIAYARLGIGRPPGALTPSEARSVVHELTRSDDLGSQAAALVARCDGWLFSQRQTDHDAEQLVANARELFRALGRASVSRPPETPISEPQTRASE